MIQPPAAATALLHVFLPGPERDSVTGDLIEEFQSRPSRAWYWTQVLRSLGDFAWIGMRRAPGRTIGAMLAGYAATAAAVIASFAAWEALGGSHAAGALQALELGGGFFASALGGYIAARISRGSGANGILALCALSLVMGCASLATIPFWKEMALLAVFVPGILAGGYLRARQIAR